MPRYKAIQKLEQAGIIVLPLAKEPGTADSFTLFKPTSVKGRSHPDWDYMLETEQGEVACDAPCGTLDLLEGKWVFCVNEFSPEPGSEEFCRPCDTLDEAVAEAFRFYFGEGTD